MSEAEIGRLLQAAVTAQRAGDLRGAAQHFENVLKIAPDHAPALNSLGVLALDTGDTEFAVALHKRAAEADAGAPVLWLNLAKAQRAARDDAGERAALAKALEIDPLMFMALVRKAELHERLGEHAHGLPAWQAVIATIPAERNAGLDTLLAHAQDYVREQLTAFADTIDTGLAEARAAAGGDLRRFDACTDALVGRRRIYANHCHGTHFPFLPADEFFPREHFAWMEKLEAQTEAIRAELASLLETGAPGFEPYVTQAPGTPQNKWSALDASTDWSAYYLWHYGKPVADAHMRCPATVAALAELPLIELTRRSPTAFFSILKPRTRIPPHTGVTNIRAIVHLPLIVPEGCGFRVGGETRQWEVGKAFAFDDTIEHEAWNDSDELRAVLILDVWNPHITEAERGMLAKYFEVADASGHNPNVEDVF